MAYSTEAHLFITDLNQSPFNVGTRLILGDFSRGDIVDLNRRYGFPLKGDAEIERFVAVVGGHPYLVQRGLREMVASGTQVVPFESLAYSENWVYADHLSRIAAILLRQSDLLEAVRDILHGRQATDMDRIFRLRSAGILAGRGGKPAEFRCKLYEVYLRRRLL